MACDSIKPFLCVMAAVGIGNVPAALLFLLYGQAPSVAEWQSGVSVVLSCALGLWALALLRRGA